MHICGFRGKKVTEIHRIPFYVTKLTCNGNSIIKLPEYLPCMLESLLCAYTGITRLPENLPDGLKILECMSSRLIKLPDKLPTTLEELNCSGNMLTALPRLPLKLKKLHCSANPINELPEIPPDLIELSCRECNLKYLPDLPHTLRDICIDLNPEIKENYPLLVIDIENISISPEICIKYNYPWGMLRCFRLLGCIMYINDCNSRRRTQARVCTIAQELEEAYLRKVLHPSRLAPLLDDPDADPQDFMDALGDSI